MKKLLLFVFAALLSTGCVKHITEVEMSGETGVLSLSLSGEDGEIVISPSKAAEVAVSSFYVEIYKSSGTLVNRYESYSDVPEALELEAGVYTIKAANGDMLSAAFDSPHYYGETTVTIEVGLETSATVVCSIDNVLLNITYSDNVLSAMTDIEVLATSVFYATDGVSKASGSLVYTPTSSTEGWFTPPYNGEISLSVTGVSVATGTTQKVSAVITGVQAGQSRSLEVDVEITGDGSLTIIIDSTLDEVDDGTILLPDDGGGTVDPGTDPDPDEPQVDPDPELVAPTILGALFGTEESSAPFNIDEPVDFDLDVNNVLDILLTSSAEGGIQEMGVTIDSPTLTPALLEVLLGTSGEMDFANPDTDMTWYTMFTSEDIALIDPNDPIKGKTEHTFVVGKLLLMLKTMQVTGTVTHNFTIRLKDANGEITKTLSVNLTKH